VLALAVPSLGIIGPYGVRSDHSDNEGRYGQLRGGAQASTAGLWLRRVDPRLDLLAKTRDRGNEVAEIKDLFQLGLQLMDQAENVSNGSAADV
jgi:hypothetical protein